jgi:hypothetical protein
MKKLSSEVFIEKAKLIHFNKYDYSKIDYINSRTKVEIVCLTHGSFWQKADDHLRGSGCHKCKKTFPLTSEIFIEKAIQIHGDKYDYSMVEYINTQTKITIICPIHGKFIQTPNRHLAGQGCAKCAENEILTTDAFIDKAKMIHSHRYNYSQSEYVRSSIKIKIICPNHGVFEQTPNRHLMGDGCPKCKESKGESKIRNFLIANNINYQYQYKINKCRNIRPLLFDFAIFINNRLFLIEYDGIQHFIAMKLFGGKNKFNILQKNDKIKNKYCLENNIHLLRIKYTDYDYIEEILNKIIKT